MNITMGVIGEEAHFYGYIIGVSLERGDDLKKECPEKMFAMFEHNMTRSVYEVPDYGLFSILAGHLLDNARSRAEHGDYGYAKLWIEKKDGKWDVDVP